MTDYSALDKLLHHLTLGSRTLSKTLFDIDGMLVGTEVDLTQTVYVLGFARCGTTALTEGLYQTKEFASLTYSDMPFVMAPNLWSKISNFQKKKSRTKLRSHGDGVYLNFDSPEAFEEVFWQTFCEDNYIKNQYVQEHECSDDIIEKLTRYHKLICYKYNKNRYLAKNNNMLVRLNSVVQKKPRAKFLIMYREPLSHAKSLLNQHRNFSNSTSFTRNYMKWLAHFEFGITHKPFRFNKAPTVNGNPQKLQYWVDRWTDAYAHVLNIIDTKNTENIILLSYDKLVKDDKLWHFLVRSLNLKNSSSPFNRRILPTHSQNEIYLDKAIEVHQKLEGTRKFLEKINSSSKYTTN